MCHGRYYGVVCCLVVVVWCCAAGSDRRCDAVVHVPCVVLHIGDLVAVDLGPVFGLPAVQCTSAPRVGDHVRLPRL